MVLPNPFLPANYASLHYYQGIMIVEVALTLVIFIVLQVIHYIKWGYDEEQTKDAKEGEAKPAPQQQETSRKWDQKAWNVYFPIIFANHIAGISLIIVYIPYVYSAVIAFLHFALFCGLVVVNIFIKDAEPGKGSRTKVSRILWGLMCFFNVMLIIGGLTGVANVYQ